MTGDIYINQQIGTSYNEDGTVNVKGFELQDFIAQYEPMKSFEKVMVHITSGGGYVATGTAIADYISSFSNIETIAKEYCASIATIIHLAPPIENRLVEEGTVYMVHNPLLSNISGNAEELTAFADGIKPIQNEMVKSYVKATGLSKQGVEAIMKQETSLTDEQVISMGFASAIIPKIEIKAIALIEKRNVNISNMSDETFAQKVKNALASIGIKIPVADAKKVKNFTKSQAGVIALVLPTDNGTLETEFMEISLGDSVVIDGVTAPEGNYTMDDGTVIVVSADGTIAEIQTPSVLIDSLTLEMKTKLDEEISALKTENETLKAEKTTFEAEKLTVLETIQALKKIGSTHVPNVMSHIPQRQGTQAPKKSAREEMNERKASYKDVKVK